MYLFGVLFIKNLYVSLPATVHWGRCIYLLPIQPNHAYCLPCSILVFIITLLLLSADFYYLKNIAGRRLVGLRWWNEVNMQTGESHWVFESSDPNTRVISATDKRFFWLGLYSTPALWIGLAVLAIIRLQSVIWLSLVAIALILTITNTLAFSRCDRFSQASSFASNALSGGIAGNFATGMFGRIF
ncbi:hypothetical protein TRV_06652 [Trichophyton verrucosum HKI 0517]|uniref:Golgi apparatus membrane protein TVP23 n=1 Tax=Trichophyton verrucosum (strain HKI 0517) TaxID=663202 RepID=D4DHJ6_TRIVH|nr:uncharacterized protein TRV_06652 [Trichophyton verrucosum HKI 0517]EFE38663.1 hypothetical protein TRV_06652 [Trichophyton verrucosum HKI 0517]